MSQTVLVTGGAGYIGSHACKILARAGHQPIVFDNLSRGHRQAVRWGPLVEGDLADRERLIATLQTHRISAVMHFAAYAYVGEFGGRPGTLLPEQPRRHAIADRGDARSPGGQDRLFVDMRHLRSSQRQSYPRDSTATPGQPLWRDKARDRAGAALVRGGLPTPLGLASVFQCRRRRFRRRDR